MKKKVLSKLTFVLLFAFAMIIMNVGMEKVNATGACTGTCSCSCSGITGSFTTTENECESTCREYCTGSTYVYTDSTFAGCSCPGGEYLSGSTCVACPRGYTSNAGAVGDTQCYKVCAQNTYMEFATASECSACPEGQTSSQHTVYYRNTSSCTGTSSKPKAVISCVSGVTYNGSAQVIATCSGGQISDEGFGPGRGKAVGPVTFSCTGDSEHSDADQKSCSIGTGTATHTCNTTGYIPYTEDNGNDVICKISCAAGTHVAVANGSCVPCDDGYISQAHYGIEGSTTNCTKCTGTKACSNSDHTACVACSSGGDGGDSGGEPTTTYTITANANGGTITATTGWTNATDNLTATKSVSSGDAYGTLPTVTYTEKTLKEWNTKADGTGTVVTASTTASAAATIFAIWNSETSGGTGDGSDTKTITFNANGGTIVVNGNPSGTYEATDVVTKTLAELLNGTTTIREGYTLKGWYTQAEDGDAVALENPLSDVSATTLYAQWTEGSSEVDPSQPTVTLTYNSNGGTACAPSTRTVNTGQPWGTLCTPTFKGYNFNGWYTAKKGGTKVTSSTIANSDLTVYAQWRKTTNPKTGLFTPILAILVLGVISSVTFLVVKRKSAGI